MLNWVGAMRDNIERDVQNDYDNPVNLFSYETYVPARIRNAEEYKPKPWPKSLQKPDRKQCMPDPNNMLKAVEDGVELAELMNENAKAEPTTMEQFINGGWSLLAKITGQLWTDTKEAQACMDEQDAKYKADVAEYVEDILTLDEPKPAPIVYSKEQKFANFRQADEKRQKAGLSPITWFEYEAMVNKGLDPLNGSSLKEITNSELCPHGGGSSGNSAVGSVGGGSDSGPSQSDTNFCFINDDGSVKSCHKI